MRFRVLLFAGLRDRVGAEVLECELSEAEASVAGLRLALERQRPELAGQVYRVAVDAAYAVDGDRLPPGAELALIPPVSGG
ncbi:MAG: MoaD/ThiS family protein [Planctomycetes bacterium]|nr:MoaD/ThiS family protein [Planctomycetota bacterium]MBL7007517.1 MoaD/ThiS family protein [Planctomycetota bacterium]